MQSVSTAGNKSNGGVKGLSTSTALAYGVDGEQWSGASAVLSDPFLEREFWCFIC